MAILSTAYGVNIDYQSVEDCDKELNQIITQVQHYLYNFGQSWFFLALGKSYFKKCCRSWVRVSTHLEKFLNDPRTNYSLLMVVLEHEIDKFPKGSFYAQKLLSLQRLVSLGPHFSFNTIMH